MLLFKLQEADFLNFYARECSLSTLNHVGSVKRGTFNHKHIILKKTKTWTRCLQERTFSFNNSRKHEEHIDHFEKWKLLGHQERDFLANNIWMHEVMFIYVWDVLWLITMKFLPVPFIFCYNAIRPVWYAMWRTNEHHVNKM